MTDSTASPIAPIPPPVPGTITLARHGEPALSRKLRLNGDEYRAWWARYEVGGLLEGQVVPADLQDIARRSHVTFTSARRRAIESATLVVGDGAFTTDPIFIEAPLPPPPIPSFVRLNPKVWGFISRFCWWYFRYREADEETRNQAAERAKLAADMLEAPVWGGRNVLLVAHGFFNTMIGIELKQRGWKCVAGRGWRYWNTRTFSRG